MSRRIGSFVVFMFFLAFGTLNVAGALEVQPEQQIAVRMYNYAEVPNEPLQRSKKEAARILRGVGVRAQWFECAVSAEKAGYEAACMKPRGPTDVVLKLLPYSMAVRLNRKPGTFGFAVPASGASLGTAFVFVREAGHLAFYGSFPTSFETTRAVLLGHLMAHEIGHLLLGAGSHSTTGIMCFPWSKRVLKRVAKRNLSFTPRQARLVQERCRRLLEGR